MVHKSSALANNGSSGGSQTPWTSNIDGGGYNLSHVNELSAIEYAFSIPNYYQAASFNGSNSQVIGFDNNLPTGDAPRAISLWMNIVSGGSGQILTGYGTNSTNEEFIMYSYSSGLVLNVGTHLAEITSGGWEDGNWHLVILNYSGSGTSKWTVDNVGRTNGISLSGAINTVKSGNQYLGQTPSISGARLNGVLAQVRYYNTTLTTAQMNDLWNGGAGVQALPASIPSSSVVTEFLLNGNANDTSGSGNTDASANITYVNGHILTGSYSSTASAITYTESTNTMNVPFNVNIEYTLYIGTDGSSISSSGGNLLVSADNGIDFDNNLLPTSSDTYNLGENGTTWAYGYIDFITTGGGGIDVDNSVLRDGNSTSSGGPSLNYVNRWLLTGGSQIVLDWSSGAINGGEIDLYSGFDGGSGSGGVYSQGSNGYFSTQDAGAIGGSATFYGQDNSGNTASGPDGTYAFRTVGQAYIDNGSGAGVLITPNYESYGFVALSCPSYDVVLMLGGLFVADPSMANNGQGTVYFYDPTINYNGMITQDNTHYNMNYQAYSGRHIFGSATDDGSSTFQTYGTMANQGATTTTGSSVGTLTNAPAVGNPHAYLEMVINGRTSYIPYW